MLFNMFSKSPPISKLLTSAIYYHRLEKAGQLSIVLPELKQRFELQNDQKQPPATGGVL